MSFIWEEHETTFQMPLATFTPHCHTSPVLIFTLSPLGVEAIKIKIWCQAYAVSKQPLGCRAPSKINHPY